MDTTGDQVVDRLKRMIGWAKKLRASSLQSLLERHGDRVHFRPAASGIAMVGLLHDFPQLGKSGLTNLERLEASFEEMFSEHCATDQPERATPEKQLQSFLIRESYKNGRRMVPINEASGLTNDPVDLVFVTDEISLPLEGDGKTVCDILALRRDGGRSTPVLLELKSERSLKRLVAQVDDYSTLMQAHETLFAELFSAILGEEIHFDGPPEKWIVWPMKGDEHDRQEEDLATKRIRVVGYTPRDDGYALRVGRGKLG